MRSLDTFRSLEAPRKGAHRAHSPRDRNPRTGRHHGRHVRHARRLSSALTKPRRRQQKRGGHLRIARQEDSQSFDKTNVFQNESIWLAQQINEGLYTVGPDGKTLKPWLATGYKVSKNGKKYTIKLRKGVRFSNGKAMTAADVKFSYRRRARAGQGWGYLDVGIKNIQAPNPSTVVFNLKYRWGPFLSITAFFANGIIPKNFAGQKRAEFYKHPIGTGPFMWDKRVVGQSVSFKRNPYYWQKGKPYLDRVTWTYVSDQNTRELQLRGGQIEVNEFPPFSSIKKLQNTTGVKMFLFPSTRTDYLLMNEAYAPLKDVHVRRAISYSIDRAGIARAILFGFGKPANSFMPPQVPYYDPKSPGIQYNPAKAKAELAKSKYKNGFTVEMLVGAGAMDESRARPGAPAGAEGAENQSQVPPGRHEHGVHCRSRSASTSWHLATGRWTSPTRTSS